LTGRVGRDPRKNQKASCCSRIDPHPPDGEDRVVGGLGTRVIILSSRRDSKRSKSAPSGMSTQKHLRGPRRGSMKGGHFKTRGEWKRIWTATPLEFQMGTRPRKAKRGKKKQESWSNSRGLSRVPVRTLPGGIRGLRGSSDRPRL